MKRQIVHGLILAGLTLGAAVALVTARKLGWIEADLTVRLMMAVNGLVLVWSSNFAPKMSLGRRPAAMLAVSRAMVLGGFFYAGVWLVAPMDVAAPLSMAGLVAAMGFGVASCLLSKRAS